MLASVCCCNARLDVNSELASCGVCLCLSLNLLSGNIK